MEEELADEADEKDEPVMVREPSSEPSFTMAELQRWSESESAVSIYQVCCRSLFFCQFEISMSAVWSRNIVEPNLKQISVTFSGLLGGSISPRHTPIIAVFFVFFLRPGLAKKTDL